MIKLAHCSNISGEDRQVLWREWDPFGHFFENTANFDYWLPCNMLTAAVTRHQHSFSQSCRCKWLRKMKSHTYGSETIS